MTSAITLAVNYCPIYHTLFPLALYARCVRISYIFIVAPQSSTYPDIDSIDSTVVTPSTITDSSLQTKTREEPTQGKTPSIN